MEKITKLLTATALGTVVIFSPDPISAIQPSPFLEGIVEPSLSPQDSSPLVSGDVIIIRDIDSAGIWLAAPKPMGQSENFDLQITYWRNIGVREFVIEVPGREKGSIVRSGDKVNLRERGWQKYLTKDINGYRLYPMSNPSKFQIFAGDIGNPVNNGANASLVIDGRGWLVRCSHDRTRVCTTDMGDALSGRYKNADFTWTLMRYNPAPPRQQTSPAPRAAPNAGTRPNSPAPQRGSPYICMSERDLNFAGCQARYVYLCNSDDRPRSATITYRDNDGTAIVSRSAKFNVPANASISSGATELPGGSQFAPYAYSGQIACQSRNHSILSSD